MKRLHTTSEIAFQQAAHSIARPIDHSVAEDELVLASESEQQASPNAIEQFVAIPLRSRDVVAQRSLGQVREIVRSFGGIATYFHKSPKAKNRLVQIEVKDWKRSALHLITDCPTRWNSCRDMIARMIELQAPLDNFLAVLRDRNLRRSSKS